MNQSQGGDASLRCSYLYVPNHGVRFLSVETDVKSRPHLLMRLKNINNKLHKQETFHAIKRSNYINKFCKLPQAVKLNQEKL